MSSRDQEVAKVIWYYNVGDKKKVICMYDKTMEEMINEYRPLYEKHDINRVL